MASDKLRVIVMTDISSLTTGVLEPDDGESMVRFLLYSNEWDVEGLIATAYRSGKGELSLGTDLLHQEIDAYAAVLPNLRVHADGYADPEQLHAVVKTGYLDCGVHEPGEGLDTEASEWIISVLDRADERPVWVLLWGGSTDLAQAIWRVRQRKAPADAAKWLAKLRIYSINDQYGQTGPWIRKNAPEIFYMTSYLGHRGVYRRGDENLSGEAWVMEHIKKNKGALGDLYPVYHGGDPWGRVDGLKEGDTPSFLYLIPNGLHDVYIPEQSNWGGVFETGEGQYVSSADDTAIAFSAQTGELVDSIVRQMKAAAGDRCEQAGVYRWRADFQNDFAARLNWCISSEKAGVSGAPIVHVLENSAEDLQLFDASSSESTDGSPLVFRWILELPHQLREEAASGDEASCLAKAKSLAEAIVFDRARPFCIGIDRKKLENAQLIACVSGSLEPAMTRYQRFIVG